MVSDLLDCRASSGPRKLKSSLNDGNISFLAAMCREGSSGLTRFQSHRFHPVAIALRQHSILRNGESLQPVDTDRSSLCQRQHENCHGLALGLIRFAYSKFFTGERNGDLHGKSLFTELAVVGRRHIVLHTFGVEAAPSRGRPGAAYHGFSALNKISRRR
ncbi:protein of unknown function [Hyphomicrobium sp. MC1]|nr:protein of unknown function [Hyphomicrobium sp. MC1]